MAANGAGLFAVARWLGASLTLTLPNFPCPRRLPISKSLRVQPRPFCLLLPLPIASPPAALPLPCKFVVIVAVI